MVPQTLADDVFRILQERQTPGFNPNNMELERRLIGEGFFMFGQHFLADRMDEQLTYLASVPKVLIAETQARALEHLPSAQPIDLEVLMELHQRQPQVFNQRPDLFADMLPAVRIARVAQVSRSAKAPAVALQKIIERGNKMLEGKVLPTEELYRQAIQLSSNAATRVIKAQERLRYGSSDALQAAYRLLAPTYVMNRQDESLWNQPLANTGKLSEFVELLHSMITAYYEGKANKYQRILMESMINNPQDFKHCGTHARWGKALQAEQKVAVFEKTGLYPSATWAIGLGLPSHMAMSTVIGLAWPDGKLVVFGGYWNIEMPVPWEPVTNDGISYYDEFGKEFHELYQRTHAYYAPVFRDWLWANVSEHGFSS